MDVKRVGLIYDDSVRPETTGIYCRRALSKLLDVEHFSPSELQQIPAGKFDLFLVVDDGLNYRLPERLRPAAYWAIDTHIDFPRSLARSADFDFVFAAQRDGTEKLKKNGIDSALWLALACDPEIHRPHRVKKHHDLCFVGRVIGRRRQELIGQIRRRYAKTLVQRCTFEAMARAYSAARIVFNRSVEHDVNMRVFEALACGSLLVTNDLASNGQEELFKAGRHLATYRDREELFERIDFYLRHEEARERIARAGRREVLARHTYRHRMETLLRRVEKGLSATTIGWRERSRNSPVSGKDRGYFEFARPELLERIPQNARRVLDVGCGAGKLGASLKRRQQAEVWGIERNESAARSARKRLDRVLVRDAEQVDSEIGASSFDCIVCGDVLEHMREPDAFLRRTRAWLTTGGCIVASIPNIRHHSVVGSLLAGNWTYEAAGLLDRDHVRFFTRREIEKLFFRAGYHIEALQVVAGSGYREWVKQGRPGEVSAGRLQIRGLASEEAEEFYVYQYLVVAVPERIAARKQTRSGAAKTGTHQTELLPLASDRYRLTSILLVTHNQLRYTRKCLESIRQFTDERYELIVVDNGSTDGTPDYIRDLDNVTLITNADNRGFPAAVNQGIQRASGKQILLLNNDTIVTTGWLRRMLEVLDSDDSIGLVGPVSNNVSGVQRISADYTDLAELDGFAWSRKWLWDGLAIGPARAESAKPRVIDVDRLVGFCLLIRREVIEEIGLLDERFGIGNFEDDDYCRRARQAGYRAVVAADVFVHHFGGMTFRATGVDFAALMRRNRRKFREKWEDGGKGIQPVRARVSDKKGNDTERRSESVRCSLCMIVRDNEKTIGPCLESIRPWVDELVIVDTGSKDRTAEICREYGARVFNFPWRDDFSAARNESFKGARGEWLFWMDSDDTIPEECGRKLRKLVDGEHAENVFGYVMQVHCPAPAAAGMGDGDVTIVDHVKLVRNRPDISFEHRIHEQLLPSIRRAGGEVAWSDIYVVHSGSDHSPEGRRRKLERDYRILKRDLEDHPDHPFVLFNLGMTYADDERFDEAIKYIRRCVDVSRPQESHLRKAYALLAGACSQSGRTQEAEEACRCGLELFPGDKELLFRSAMLHHQCGRLQEAIAAYLRVLNQPSTRHFSSIDSGVQGYKARHNLAIVYNELGESDKAEAEWRQIVREHPCYEPAWRGLIETLLKRQKFNEADRVVKTLLRRGHRRVLVLDLQARLLFETAGPAGALSVLAELAELTPEDASVFHNLGTARLQQKDYPGAAVAFRRSLELRPDSPEAEKLLNHAVQQSGRPEEASSRETG